MIDNVGDVLTSTGKALGDVGLLLVTPVTGSFGQKTIPILEIGKGVLAISKILGKKR